MGAKAREELGRLEHLESELRKQHNSIKDKIGGSSKGNSSGSNNYKNRVGISGPMSSLSLAKDVAATLVESRNHRRRSLCL